jgi:hypothetical protein
MASASSFALSREVPAGQGRYDTTFRSVQFKTTPERALSVASQYARDNRDRTCSLSAPRSRETRLGSAPMKSRHPVRRSDLSAIVERYNTPRKLPVGEHQARPGPSRSERWPEPLP